jgi:uncharacterized DUF497 family protein
MVIVWDERKRQANIEKHGFDFSDLDESFFDAATIYPTRNRRLVAIGRLDDGTIAVIFALLGTEAISIISMRSASLRERRQLR